MYWLVKLIELKTQTESYVIELVIFWNSCTNHVLQYRFLEILDNYDVTLIYSDIFSNFFKKASDSYWFQHIYKCFKVSNT